MDPSRLKAIEIFSHLSDEEARRLAAFATETSVAEGQILMKQGDYSTELIGIEEKPGIAFRAFLPKIFRRTTTYMSR